MRGRRHCARFTTPPAWDRSRPPGGRHSAPPRRPHGNPHKRKRALDARPAPLKRSRQRRSNSVIREVSASRHDCQAVAVKGRPCA